jgi:arylsulfatase A-like enzyme
MRRRLSIAALAIATLAAASLTYGSNNALASPNILVVVTDDQRADTLGAMPATRRIFFRKGRAFRPAFVTTPLCCPSRASIFTGLFAHNHGIKSNGSAALPQDRTVQRYLDDAGYMTALVGKYLNSWPLRADPPYFDRWALIRPDSYVNAEFNLNGRVRTLPGYSTNVIARKAVDWLRRFESNDARPWFLYLAPVAPHRPATPAPEYGVAAVPRWRPPPSVFEGNRSDKPPWFRTKSASLESVRDFRARQLRTLMSVDDLIAKVFQQLGLLHERRTLAVFMSDNGFLWGEHGLTKKFNPYTEAVAVPLALRWPGHLAPGTTDRRNATNLDIAPTVLDAAGVDPATPMDGRSLLDTWTRRAVFTEYWARPAGEDQSWKAVRTRGAHYIEYYSDDFSRVLFREYYQLRRDPWELRNLLHDGDPSNNPDTRAERAWIRQYQDCSGSSCPGVSP